MFKPARAGFTRGGVVLACPIAIKRCYDFGNHGIEAASIAAIIALVGVGQLAWILLPPESVAALPSDLLEALRWTADHQRYLWTGALAASVSILVRPGNPGPNRFGAPPGAQDGISGPATPDKPQARKRLSLKEISCTR